MKSRICFLQDLIYVVVSSNTLVDVIVNHSVACINACRSWPQQLKPLFFKSFAKAWIVRRTAGTSARLLTWLSMICGRLMPKKVMTEEPNSLTIFQKAIGVVDGRSILLRWRNNASSRTNRSTSDSVYVGNLMRIEIVKRVFRSPLVYVKMSNPA